MNCEILTTSKRPGKKSFKSKRYRASSPLLTNTLEFSLIKDLKPMLRLHSLGPMVDLYEDREQLPHIQRLCSKREYSLFGNSEKDGRVPRSFSLLVTPQATQECGVFDYHA
jgi:hypothetical protein